MASILAQMLSPQMPNVFCGLFGWGLLSLAASIAGMRFVNSELNYFDLTLACTWVLP